MTAAMVVHLPALDRLMRAEIRLRHPSAVLRTYDGDPLAVPRARGDVLVIFCTTQPPGVGRGFKALGEASRRHRAVIVCVRDVRACLRLRWTDPRLLVALGRVVAHELEHLRRTRAGHDRSGWFRGCVTAEELLA